MNYIDLFVESQHFNKCLFEHIQAIQAHADGCKQNLMQRKVFDFKDDPAGDIHDTAKCYIQTKAGVLDKGR